MASSRRTIYAIGTRLRTLNRHHWPAGSRSSDHRTFAARLLGLGTCPRWEDYPEGSNAPRLAGRSSCWLTPTFIPQERGIQRGDFVIYTPGWAWDIKLAGREI